MLHAIALVGSILVFVASFSGSATYNALYISAVSAGGIWYLMPFAGLAGIIFSSMSVAGKADLKIPSFIIGGIVLVMGCWLAVAAQDSINQIIAMQAEMSQGFNSSFFTGQLQNTSALPKSSLGTGLFLDVIGALALIAAGYFFEAKSKDGGRSDIPEYKAESNESAEQPKTQEELTIEQKRENQLLESYSLGIQLSSEDVNFLKKRGITI